MLNQDEESAAGQQYRLVLANQQQIFQSLLLTYSVTVNRFQVQAQRLFRNLR